MPYIWLYYCPIWTLAIQLVLDMGQVSPIHPSTRQSWNTFCKNTGCHPCISSIPWHVPWTAMVSISPSHQPSWLWQVPYLNHHLIHCYLDLWACSIHPICPWTYPSLNPWTCLSTLVLLCCSTIPTCCFSTPFMNSLFNSFKWFRLFTIFNLLSK